MVCTRLLRLKGVPEVCPPELSRPRTREPSAETESGEREGSLQLHLVIVVFVPFWPGPTTVATRLLALSGLRGVRGRGAGEPERDAREAGGGGEVGRRGARGALEAFVLWLTNIRVCAGELGAFDAHLCVGSACAGEA